MHSPRWSKWVSVPWGPGMEHTRRALRNVLQRLMRLRFPPTSFCRAPRANLRTACPSLPHHRAHLGPAGDIPSPEPSALWWEGSDTPLSCCWPLLGMSLGPEKVKPPWWDTSHSMLALVTDLADPGHPSMDVPPLPLPSFHGHLSEKDVDLVIMWVVGIRDGVGTDKRRLCRGKEQHSMVLCLDPTLRSPLEQREVLRVRRVSHGDPATRRQSPIPGCSGCRGSAGTWVPSEASSGLPPRR